MEELLAKEAWAFLPYALGRRFALVEEAAESGDDLLAQAASNGQPEVGAAPGPARGADGSMA